MLYITQINLAVQPKHQNLNVPEILSEVSLDQIKCQHFCKLTQSFGPDLHKEMYITYHRVLGNTIKLARYQLFMLHINCPTKILAGYVITIAYDALIQKTHYCDQPQGNNSFLRFCITQLLNPTFASITF